MNQILTLIAQANPVPQAPAVTEDEVSRAVVEAKRVAAAGSEAERAAAAAPTSSRPRRRLRTISWGVGAAAAAAAVPVAVAVLPGGTPAPAAADPVQVLNLAAAALRSAPAVTPRADQFVYEHDGDYQAWLSVDGTHDGLVKNPTFVAVPGCVNGTMLAAGNYPGLRPAPCTPQPAYLPDVPTEPGALRAWLRARANGPNEKKDPTDATGVNAFAKTAMTVLTQNYTLPATRSALFRVMSTYPGLSVTTYGVPTGCVGITWSYGGGHTTLVFERTTHDYLGTADDDGDVTVATLKLVEHVGDT